MSSKKSVAGKQLYAGALLVVREELEVLNVLLGEQAGEQAPLKLSDVYSRICEQRRKHGEPEPLLADVTADLRNLTAKGLVEEVATSDAARPVRTRGMLSPGWRSSPVG